jgi:hypothetical protein
MSLLTINPLHSNSICLVKRIAGIFACSDCIYLAGVCAYPPPN